MAKLSGIKMKATSEIMENNTVQKYLQIGTGKNTNYVHLSNVSAIKDIDDTVSSNKYLTGRKYGYNYTATLDITGDTLYFLVNNDDSSNGSENVKAIVNTAYRKYVSAKRGDDVLKIPDYLIGQKEPYVWWDICDPIDQTGETSMSDTTGTAISNSVGDGFTAINAALTTLTASLNTINETLNKIEVAINNKNE